MPNLRHAMMSAAGAGGGGGGEIWGSGNNAQGNLGDGTDNSRCSPVQFGSETDWISATGQRSTQAINTSGELWVSGYNVTGTLGLGNTTNYSSPVQVGSLTDWISADNEDGIGIDEKNRCALAIKTDGTLWGWGANYWGAIGDGTLDNKSSPVQVGSLTDWAACIRGYSTSFFVKTNGTLWVTGSNVNAGVTGLGNTNTYSSPVQVGSLTNWSPAPGHVVSYRYGSFAIKTDGTLWAWGANGAGMMGVGNTTAYSSPIQVGSLTDWAFLGGGQHFGAAVKTDGTLWTWGSNSAGRLGLGNETNYSSPVQVGSLTDWSRVTIGYNGQCAQALKTDGTVWAWGGGGKAMGLGTGSSVDYCSPVQVGSLTTWIMLGTKLWKAVKTPS